MHKKECRLRLQWGSKPLESGSNTAWGTRACPRCDRPIPHTRRDQERDKNLEEMT
jgi:hypothetical protein